MKRSLWLTMAGGALVAALAYVGLRPAPKEPAPRPPFSGVRARTTGVTYSQEDPVTGSTLIVRARVAVARDGKVGRLFRSPLRPEVELSGVEAELRDRERSLVLEARSEAGVYAPDRGEVSLDRPSVVNVGDRQVQTRRLILRPDGRAELPGPYDVYRGTQFLGRGRTYSGEASEIGLRREEGGPS